MQSLLCYFKLEVQSEYFSNGFVSYMKCYQVRPVRKVEKKKKKNIFSFGYLEEGMCMYMYVRENQSDFEGRSALG